MSDIWLFIVVSCRYLKIVCHHNESWLIKGALTGNKDIKETNNVFETCNTKIATNLNLKEVVIVWTIKLPLALNFLWADWGRYQQPKRAISARDDIEKGRVFQKVKSSVMKNNRLWSYLQKQKWRLVKQSSLHSSFIDLTTVAQWDFRMAVNQWLMGCPLHPIYKWVFIVTSMILNGYMGADH